MVVSDGAQKGRYIKGRLHLESTPSPGVLHSWGKTICSLLQGYLRPPSADQDTKGDRHECSHRSRPRILKNDMPNNDPRFANRMRTRKRREVEVVTADEKLLRSGSVAGSGSSLIRPTVLSFSFSLPFPLHFSFARATFEPGGVSSGKATELAREKNSGSQLLI